MKIDSLDVSILRHLQDDARTSFNAIAKACDTTTDTVSKRFKRMVRDGLVRKTTIIKNPRRFGQDCIAIFGISVGRPVTDATLEHLQRVPGVLFCSRSFGSHDIIGIVVMDSIDHLGSVQERIRDIPSIKDLYISIFVGDYRLCKHNLEFDIEKDRWGLKGDEA